MPDSFSFEPDNTRNWSAMYPWFVTLVLALTHLVSLVDRNLLGVTLVAVKTELALSDTQLGLLYGTGFAIIYSIITLPLGRLADKVNRKNLIAAGLLVWVLATAATAFAQSFSVFFGLRMVVGVGEACLVPAGMSLLMALVPKHLLGRAVAIFTTGGGQGRTVALLSGGPLLSVLTVAGGLSIPAIGLMISPWRGTFLLASLPGILLVPVLFLLREPSRPTRPNADNINLAGALKLLRPRLMAYLLYFGAFTAIATMVWSLSAWALSVFVREHGLNAGQAGGILGAIALITGPTGNLFGGWVLDKLNRRKVLAAPVLMMAAPLLIAIGPIVMFCASKDVESAVAGYALLQFVLAWANAPAWAGVQLLTPPESRGLVMALFVATYSSVSLGVGPVLVGFLSDFIFSGTTGLGDALLLTLLVLAVVGTALALLGRRYYVEAIKDVAS